MGIYTDFSMFFGMVRAHKFDNDEFYLRLRHMVDKDFTCATSLLRIGEEVGEMRHAMRNFKLDRSSGNFSLLYDEICDVINYCLVHYITFGAWDDIKRPMEILNKFFDYLNLGCDYEKLIHSLIEKSRKHQMFHASCNY